jgi:predicted sulfurtransferase
LLKQKIETEDDTKSLGIKGVYQLQGGIDKYFKQFPEGGLWKGKNYVFDKRFSVSDQEVG